MCNVAGSALEHVRVLVLSSYIHLACIKTIYKYCRDEILILEVRSPKSQD